MNKEALAHWGLSFQKQTNYMGTAERILMALCTGEFYKNLLIVCYSRDPQSPTASCFTFSCFDLNTV